MKLVVDAMCAEFGGIRTYVEQLLGRWHERHPEDDVHVVLRKGSTLATPGLIRHELAAPRPDVLTRPWAQATGMHALAKRVRPDVVLATAPTTDVRRLPAPLAVVILDLRSEILPDEFSRARRLLRTISYGRSYQLAQGFLSISQRSLDDLHRLHPATTAVPGTVTHLGADHVLGWAKPTHDGPAIAFAHHTNKNPQLVLQAWARLPDPRELLVLGVAGSLRESLTREIARLGLGDRVRLAPFLSDEDFRAAFTNASMIVFPSSFEGFGLPIVEGMLLGKPVVIGPDAGCLEVAGGHGHVTGAWTPAALADAITRAGQADEQAIADAHAWASGFTWNRTVEHTRTALEAIAATPTRGSNR